MTKKKKKELRARLPSSCSTRFPLGDGNGDRGKVVILKSIFLFTLQQRSRQIRYLGVTVWVRFVFLSFQFVSSGIWKDTETDTDTDADACGLRVLLITRQKVGFVGTKQSSDLPSGFGTRSPNLPEDTWVIAVVSPQKMTRKELGSIQHFKKNPRLGVL